MTIFSCEHEWTAMLTCIYEAWGSKKGHQNIRLMLEPLAQYTLFDEYVHVEADEEKAWKVADSIRQKISYGVYQELSYCAMAYEEDILDNLYRVLILGFHFGNEVLGMVQYADIMRNREIKTRLSKEVCRFKEVVRFHEVRQSLYVAHIEPKSRLVLTLGPAFQDRMPSESWIIVDDVHREAVIHPKNEDFYFRRLNEQEFMTLLQTEQENDDYTDLWKVFFEAIAIKERKNQRCQNNLLPIWTRKHAVEFI